MYDSTAENQKDSFELADKTVMDYTARNFTQEDHFCRLSVDRTTSTLRIAVYDRVGAPVTVNGTNLETTFSLAPW